MDVNTSIDVSVIFVNYNTTNLLIQAIDSVYEKSSGFIYEIIVVDNNSPESPYTEIKKKFGDKVLFIQLEQNIGFGRANNVGIKRAKGRNVFLLNTDAYLINNAIYILNDYIDKHSEVGTCGGNLYDADEKIVYSYHRVSYGILSYELYVLTMGISLKFIKDPFYNTTTNPIPVGNVSGANMMIRAKVLKEVGLFDPDFFMYCEESELSWRIRKAGYKNMNVPDAKIVHLGGQSSTIVERKKRMELDGRRKLYIKTHGIIYYYFANFLLVVGINIRRIVYLLFNRKEDYASYSELNRIVLDVYFKNR